jgi:hypothetical protein
VKHQTAFLAEYALAHEDGRVYVVGGLLDAVNLAGFPGQLPHLSLVLKVKFSPDECGKGHVISFAGSNPGGDRLVGPALLPVVPALTAGKHDEDVPFSCVFNMRDLILKAPGTYTFTVTVDETEVQTLNLTAAPIAETMRAVSSVIRTPPVTIHSEAVQVAGAPPDQTIGSPGWRNIEAGYAAFAAGHLPEAETAFRSAVELLASLPQAHNNLGFILLLMGKADEALARFGTAARLGYPEPEVLDANMACAEFASGNYEAALAGFTKCLTSARVRSTAYLVAIDDAQFHSVEVRAAGDYVALMALNAGWSATKGARDPAPFSTIASLGLLTFPDASPARAVFTLALQHLEAARQA